VRKEAKKEGKISWREFLEKHENTQNAFKIFFNCYFVKFSFFRAFRVPIQ